MKFKDTDSYHLRVYIEDALKGNVLNSMISSKEVNLVQSLPGREDLLYMYDIETDKETLDKIVSLGLRILPFNRFGEFVISCPVCGERIDDDMILTAYTPEVLAGYNIKCHCGVCKAEVSYG